MNAPSGRRCLGAAYAAPSALLSARKAQFKNTCICALFRDCEQLYGIFTTIVGTRILRAAVACALRYETLVTL
jgi:hypothetical protein